MESAIQHASFSCKEIEMNQHSPNLNLVGHTTRLNINPEYLTPKETAEILRVSVGTLEVWRRTGAQDLPFYRVGRNIYYERSDVFAFMRTKKIAN